MHEHAIESEDGELVDVVALCSDACHIEWCAENSESYDGWSGCHETELTDWCASCGVVLPGFRSEDGEPCDCQCENIVVNRFRSENGERCHHGNWIQLPERMLR